MLTLPPTPAEPSRGGARDVPARSVLDRAGVRGNAFVAFLLHTCCGPGTSRAPVAVSRCTRPRGLASKNLGAFAALRDTQFEGESGLKRGIAIPLDLRHVCVNPFCLWPSLNSLVLTANSTSNAKSSSLAAKSNAQPAMS